MPLERRPKRRLPLRSKGSVFSKTLQRRGDGTAEVVSLAVRLSTVFLSELFGRIALFSIDHLRVYNTPTVGRGLCYLRLTDDPPWQGAKGIAPVWLLGACCGQCSYWQETNFKQSEHHSFVPLLFPLMKEFILRRGPEPTLCARVIEVGRLHAIKGPRDFACWNPYFNEPRVSCIHGAFSVS